MIIESLAVHAYTCMHAVQLELIVDMFFFHFIQIQGQVVFIYLIRVMEKETQQLEAT